MSLREKKVLVVGGGIAGAAAALELSEEGLDVILLEKEDFIGGHAARMTCKALDACQKCNGCLVEPRLAALLTNPAVRIMRRSRVAAASRAGGGFRVSVQRRPAYIDPARCTACGLCLERCPQAEEGAIVGPRLPGDLPPLAVNAEACLYFQDRQSSLCVDVCPEGAIDFGRQGDEFTIQADAVVLAAGFRPYPAEEKPRLGYGRIPNVITSMDLELMLRERGGVCRPSDGAPPKRVGFIQCVGSRERRGRNYCSRVCCGYALRLGRMLRSRFGMQVSIFYMDLQSFGHAIDEFLEAAREELELIRSMPYDVFAGEDGTVLTPYQAESGRTLTDKEFDLLVLSVGMIPGEDHQLLSEAFGMQRDQHGFLTASPGDGVFVAGSAGRPMDVAESVVQAEQAARAVTSYLREA